MIKFKKILEKAAGQAGSSGGMMPLIIGARSFSRRSAAAAPSLVMDNAPPGAPAPEAPAARPASDLSLEAPPPEGLVSEDLIESVLEQVAAQDRDVPAAGQVAPAERAQAAQPAADIAADAGEAAKAAAADVIPEEASEPAAAVAAGPEENPETAVEGGVSAQEAALLAQADVEEVLSPPASPGRRKRQPRKPPSRKDSSPSTQHRDGAEGKSFVDDILSQAFAALSEVRNRQAEDTPAEKSEPAGEKAPEAPVEPPQAQEIDESFISEVDKLLNTFGQMGDVPEAGAAGKGTRGPQGDETNAERLVTETIEALAQTASEEESAGQAEALRAFSPPGGPSVEAGDKAANVEELFSEDAGAAGGDTADPLQIITKEEQAALLAAQEEEPSSADREAPTGTAGNQPQSAAPPGADGRPGKPGEIEFDFTAATMGVEDPAEKAGVVEGDDLLSKVLADLEKLGPVEKPPKEVDKEEPEKSEEPEDFSQILSELNTEQPQVAAEKAQPDSGRKPSETRAVEVSATGLTEEELIDEAIRAADEPQTADGKTAAEENAPPAAEDKSKNTSTGEKGKTPRGGDTAAGQAPAGHKGISGGKDAEPQENAAPASPSGAAETGAATAQAAEPAPGAEADKDAVEDETTLLANLEASMTSSAGQAEEESRKPSPRKDDRKTQSDENEEEHIRNQVLSRSKDVEQKIIDEVFGQHKDYSAEIKAEMAGIETAGQENPERNRAAKQGALSTDSHMAFEGTLATAASDGSGAAYDGHLGVFWLAYQINRPFERWLTPPALKLLGTLALALLGTGLVWLAASIVKIWYNL